MPTARAAIVVLLLAGSHVMTGVAADRVYPVIELTDQEAALIDVTDGSIGDWLMVVGEPTLTVSQFPTLTQDELRLRLQALPGVDLQDPQDLEDPQDLDFRMWLAWNRATARIYVAMERADDVWANDFDRGNSNQLRSYMFLHDGAIVIGVDADQSGDPLWVDGTHVGAAWWEWLERRSRQAQFYYILPQVYDSGPHVQLSDEHIMDPRKDWLVHAPYAEGGGRVWGESPFMSVTEAYVTAFDRLIWNSPTESVAAQLNPGKTIGLLIDVTDRDDAHYDDVGHYRLGRVSDTYGTDTFIRALLLGPRGETADAPPMESIAWSRIKATFAK